MKVAFDHHIFAINRYGGASRYLFELASRLPAHGVRDVCVVAPLYINNYLAVDAGRRLTRGRYVSNRFGDWWIGLRQPVSVVDVIDRVAAPLAWRGVKPDIIHETWHTRKPVGTARRRVVTAYDLTHELFPDEFAPALIRNWIAAKRAAIKRADHIICISENTRRDLVRLYDIDPNSTSVVHLGYSTSVEAKATTTAPSNHRPFLLCVGNRAGQKNFKMLLQAYSNSPILREFDLIAFGGHPMLPDEEEEIRRLGITDRVRFESGSDQKLAARYRDAAAFVFPSLYEGFGLPPLEAMSHGCPVVCSNGGSIPEVVGDAGVYFDPKDPENMRTAIERVATTKELQADLRARGHARTKDFSWDKCATETAQIYRQIL